MCACACVCVCEYVCACVLVCVCACVLVCAHLFVTHTGGHTNTMNDTPALTGVCVCMCMCVCVHVCVYVCAFVRVCVWHTQVGIQIRWAIHRHQYPCWPGVVYMCVYVCAFVRVCAFVCVRVSVCVCVYACLCEMVSGRERKRNSKGEREMNIRKHINWDLVWSSCNPYTPWIVNFGHFQERAHNNFPKALWHFRESAQRRHPIS